jgi:tRNA threonylcarbamoyladenosine biosynthesis protein TsaB
LSFYITFIKVNVNHNKREVEVNYLAIDASTEACSVALSFNNQVTERYQLAPQSHSLLLLPMVDEVLKQAGIKLKQLDGLVFGRGPGSFTGVRIGIGVAQGLGFAAELPLVGVSTLQAMAQQAYSEHGAEIVIAAIDARMSEVYTCVYQLDANGLMQPVIKEQVLAPELLESVVKQETQIFDAMVEQTIYGVGTGWQAYHEKLTSLNEVKVLKDVEFPHASAMLTLAKQEFEQGNSVSAEQAQPSYVRDTVSWKKLPGRE